MKKKWIVVESFGRLRCKGGGTSWRNLTLAQPQYDSKPFLTCICTKHSIPYRLNRTQMQGSLCADTYYTVLSDTNPAHILVHTLSILDWSLSWGPDEGAHLTENSLVKNRAILRLENGYIIIQMVLTSFTFSRPSGRSLLFHLLRITETPRFFLTATRGKKLLKPIPRHEVFGIIVGNLRGKSGHKSRHICRRYVFSSYHHCGRTLLYSLCHAPQRYWLGWLLHVRQSCEFYVYSRIAPEALVISRIMPIW